MNILKKLCKQRYLPLLALLTVCVLRFLPALYCFLQYFEHTAMLFCNMQYQFCMLKPHILLLDVCSKL